MVDEIPTINSSFTTEAALYFAYMPFLQGGGLFVRSILQLPLGSPIKLTVHLPGDNESYIVDARVAWITPRGAQANKPAGLGCQFVGDNARNFNSKIEVLLAGMLKSSQLNDTM